MCIQMNGVHSYSSVRNYTPFIFVSCSSRIRSYRVFASETTQFLAPYEASVKSRSEDDTTPPEVLTDTRLCLGTSTSHVRIVST